MPLLRSREEGAGTPPPELRDTPLRGLAAIEERGFAAQETDCISLTVTLSRGRAASDRAGWVPGSAASWLCISLSALSDLMRLCRSPPSEDPRLDLIGAWHRPE